MERGVAATFGQLPYVLIFARPSFGCDATMVFGHPKDCEKLPRSPCVLVLPRGVLTFCGSMMQVISFNAFPGARAGEGGVNSIL